MQKLLSVTVKLLRTFSYHLFGYFFKFYTKIYELIKIYFYRLYR